jgi:PAS domain S-box-containing protein
MFAVKNIYIALSAFILSAIVGLVIITARYNRTFSGSTAAVHHTILVLDETQNALSALYELEKNEANTLTNHAIDLRRLTSDNPGQLARVDSLLTYLKDDSPHTGKLRGFLLRMQAEEYKLLSLRQTANELSRTQLQQAILSLLSAIVVLLCISVSVILHNFRKRRKAEQCLQESEQRFSLLVNHIKDYAIFMIDPKGKILTWNLGAQQIKGYTGEEVIGQDISLFYSDEDVVNGVPADNLYQTALSGRYENMGLRKRRDGSQFYADVIFTAMYAQNGEISGYVKITRDITEQKKIKDEMELALFREKELNEMKSRFVTLASHEFKTPLSVILSSTSLIEKYAGDGMQEKRLRHIQRIRSNVKNLRQILNDFLSLEKLEEGVIRNNPAENDLTELVTQTIEDMTESCQPGQDITLQIVGIPRNIIIDDHLLINILNNLISNAIKYSSGNTSVEVKLCFDQDSVSINVTDHGIGIPSEELTHLFERFFRASNTTGISGTGLGLSIVKRYLDLMGGQIEVASDPSRGTTFIFTLPATKDPIRDEISQPAI